MIHPPPDILAALTSAACISGHRDFTTKVIKNSLAARGPFRHEAPSEAFDKAASLQATH
jgi:hypothetical protein